jgi:ketosteroid isomerase-like protein
VADFRMELLEALERGESALAVVRHQARGRASGAALDETIAHLWEFREGG